MSFSKYAAALILTTAFASGCEPVALETDSSHHEVKQHGNVDTNSSQAFGGQIGGTTVTGLYYATAPRSDGLTSPTGWWIRSTTVDQFAPVLQMTYNDQSVTALATSQGFLQVTTEDGLQTVQGSSFTLQFAVGAPLNAQLRVVSANVTGSYASYVTEWAANSATTWNSFCPHPYTDEDGGNTFLPEYMIPIGGAKWRENGSRVDDTAAIQLSCTHDSIGGCVRWGLPPWESVTGMFGTPPKLGTFSLKNWHQACTRMKRNDVCGTGDPVTTLNQSAYLHTTIHHWDSLGLQTMAPQTTATMEAFWGVNGATCYNPSEYRSDLPNYAAHLQAQLALCPKPACTSAGSTGLVGSARPCLRVDTTTGNCVAN